MHDITSASNEKIKYVRSLAQKKAREQSGEYTVEGVKSVHDAISSGRNVSAVYVSVSFAENGGFDFPEGVRVYRVTDGVFEKMCDTKAPQGILAVIKIEDKKLVLDRGSAYIYCDRVQDPGNLGTIIRTADAAGFCGVILSEGCADLYNPKTVRSSMGSFFNIDVWQGVTASELLKHKERGFELFGGALGKDSVDYRSADFTKPFILIIGNEANGICEELLEKSTNVKIPIIGKAESLNAGVAAAILMYEAVRQRS